MSKIAHIMMEEYQGPWKYGQAFHPYSTKSMTLCVTWRFYLQNSDTSKKQDNVRYVFYIQKAWHFCVTQFSWYFEIVGRGGHFYIFKDALCVSFLYAKNNALSVTSLYTKVLTLCVKFLYLKKCTLRYIFISNIFCIVFSDT